MLELHAIWAYPTAFLLMLALLYLINPQASRYGLVDRADGERKTNLSATPLTAGAALYLTLFILLLLTPLARHAIHYPLDFWPAVAFLLGVLVITHMLDDIYDISAFVRLVLDGTIGIMIATVGLLQISTLGYLFGPFETTLGRWALAMTVFCFIAASNAFNMTDGIDGLCAGLGIICFTTIIALLIENGDPRAHGMIDLCALVIACLIAQYLNNQGFFGQRTQAFLGDSGARLIGFIAAIALIYSAKFAFFAPVMAYFPIAVPVNDCLILMGTRVLQGRSPLSADRLHLHHLLLDAGYSQRNTRLFIFSFALLLAGLGFYLQWANVAQWLISLSVVLTFWLTIALRLVLISLGRRREAPVSADVR